MKKLFAFVGGLINGAIVGAVATLLLTPQSGQQLREQARQRYNDMLEEGRKAAEQRREEVMADFETLKQGG